MFTEAHLAAGPANHQPLSPLDFLDRACEVHGARTAVIWGEARWSYLDFARIVARMAAWLEAQGVGRGDVVSVMLGNRPEMLAAHYAVPMLGAVLNTINTRLDTDTVGYILGHVGARVMICEAATNTVAEPAADAQEVPLHRLADTPQADEGVNLFHGAARTPDWRGRVADEWQALCLNYTSGTTGRPKGVVYHHRGAYLNALGNVMALGLDTDSVYLWTLPMFHCNGWCHTWAVTAAGGVHVCLDHVEPGAIVAAIGAHGVTHMACAPVVLYMLLDHPEPPPEGARVRVATGGAAPTASLIARLDQMGVDLVHLYGLTESFGPATLNDPGPDAPAEPDEKAALLARQGMRHVTASRSDVVDASGAPVAWDGATQGEIVLRGNTVMAGYYRDPEATATAFEGGAFHTGDVAVRHADGQIEIRDRKKDVIISGGENISSLEVESVLHAHPAVLLAAVVAAPDPKWGETPWAFIELREGQSAEAAELDAFCRDHLAGFKRPRHFVFGALPRTATGKIQKFRLRARAADLAGGRA
ncbi:acyl-CoA synthase [Rhodobacteraceae bacterium WD3A24]|nr:acyl-CoA synthase [Rhodobacteraceae bacterium WD3A24]